MNANQDLPADMDHLFDVTLSTYGGSGRVVIFAEILDKYHPGDDVIGAKLFEGPGALNEAVEWSRGEVTEFMREAEA